MHWIYHPEKEAKIVDTQEYYKFLEDGWYDTPTKFPPKELEGLAATKSVAKRVKVQKEEQ